MRDDQQMSLSFKGLSYIRNLIPTQDSIKNSLKIGPRLLSQVSLTQSKFPISSNRNSRRMQQRSGSFFFPWELTTLVVTFFSVGISTFCTPSGFFTGPKDPLRCLKYHARNLILELPSYFSEVNDTCCKRSISRLRTLYKSVSGKNDPHHLIVRQTRKICRNLSHLVITTPLIKVT